jgi:hypothetical protein
VLDPAAVLAAGVRVERPGKAHSLDRVQGGLALNFEVLDVGEPGLGTLHLPMVEQMFALNEQGCVRLFRVIL